VDTLRASRRAGETHFGSLVVSLPVPHTGGELVLHTRPPPPPPPPATAQPPHTISANPSDSAPSDADAPASRVRFDLSHPPRSAGPLTLRWAAFFTDVEHELMPVAEGHRISLTYNLYGTAPVPLAADGNPARLAAETGRRVWALGEVQAAAAAAGGGVAAAAQQVTMPAPTQPTDHAASGAPVTPDRPLDSGTTGAGVLPSSTGAVAAAGGALATASPLGQSLQALLASPLFLPLGGTPTRYRRTCWNAVGRRRLTCCQLS